MLIQFLLLNNKTFILFATKLKKNGEHSAHQTNKIQHIIENTLNFRGLNTAHFSIFVQFYLVFLAKNTIFACYFSE